MGIAERKEKEKLIKRKNIIDAAIRVFSVKGFESTTMDDIAREAEYTKKTLYSYFNSKEELYYKIILTGFKTYNSMSEEIISKYANNSESEKITMLGRATIDFNLKNPGYINAMIDYGKKFKTYYNNIDDDLVQQLYSESKHSFDVLKECIVKGVEKGEFSNRNKPEILCFSLTSFIIGIAGLVNSEESYIYPIYNKDMSELVNESLEFILSAIKK